jgi:shikimate kinase
MILILCGFKNCGKSTYGKLFALKHAITFYDTDDLIKKAYNAKNKTHCNTREIYQNLGPDSFRQFESQVVCNTPYTDPSMLSTGGGTLLQPHNINHLKQVGKIVYLKVDADILYQRLIAADQLPAFISKNAPKDDFEAMHQAREPIFTHSADYTLDIGHLSDTATITALESIYANANH